MSELANGIKHADSELMVFRLLAFSVFPAATGVHSFAPRSPPVGQEDSHRLQCTIEQVQSQGTSDPFGIRDVGGTRFLAEEARVYYILYLVISFRKSLNKRLREWNSSRCGGIKSGGIKQV